MTRSNEYILKSSALIEQKKMITSKTTNFDCLFLYVPFENISPLRVLRRPQ